MALCDHWETCACASLMADRTTLGPMRDPAAGAAGLRSGPPAGLPPPPGQRPDRLRHTAAQVLRFGCPCQGIADSTCSATTIRGRRDEWIRLGAFAQLREIVLNAYDRIVGLVLEQIAIDGSITKPPGGGAAARPPLTNIVSTSSTPSLTSQTPSSPYVASSAAPGPLTAGTTAQPDAPETVLSVPPLSTATVSVLIAGQVSGAVSASFVVTDAGLVLASSAPV